MNLVPRFMFGDLDLTDYPYSVAFGSDIGNPENIREVLTSLLTDGELLSADRTSNREIQIGILVEGSDLLETAQAEQALVLQAGRDRNTLSIDPGDGFGVTTVFDTFRADIRFERSDDGEAATLRRYALTIPALPYGRSEDLTTEVAEGIPSVGTIVNAGTSLTGWSAPSATVPGATFGTHVPANPQPANMLAVDESAVAAKAYEIVNVRYVGGLGGQDARQVLNRVTLAQAIDVPTGAYLSFEVKFDVPIGRTLTSYLDNETYQTTGVLDSFEMEAGTKSRTYKKIREHRSDRYLFRQGIVEALEDGFTRYTFRIEEDLSITSLTWAGTQLVPYADDVTASDRPRVKVRSLAVAETATLGQQVLKTIDVGGSARTSGSLHVAAPSDVVALGQVLAFTVPQSKAALGFRPDLRQWVTTPIDSSTIAGRNALTSGAGGIVFEMPASMYLAGAYTLVLDQYSVGLNQSATVETSLLVDGGVVATASEVMSWRIAAADSTKWRMFPVGTLYLPAAEIQQPTAGARVQVKVTPSAAELYDAFLLPTAGDLTIIDCGIGTVGTGASSHLWIDSPSADQPQGGYWCGTTPTRQDAVAAWSTTTVPGVHSFDAGQMLAFVVSTAAQGPTVSFDYFRRWFAHAAE